MPLRFLRLLAATSALALCLADAQAQAPVPRPTPAAGAIVAAKGGEEMRFVREDLWRSALIQQSVLGGDTLRTNEIGNLAILFNDQTQIRVGRNSTLTVNDVAGGTAGTTQLSLQGGNIWARAARGGSGVDVKTPAAVAAIRGTDWSLSVDGSRTSLIVLEGVVELSNAQGSVTVRQGEGAVASIGQAPTKFVLTNSNDREQMLFYMSLRDTFSSISTSPLTGRASRGERNRIVAIPPQARSAEDWLVLAEVAPSLDGRAVAADALAQARSQRLSASQRARADLVEAALLGSQHRWSEAAALFARAERGLDPKRRIFASYGRYVAQSLADPKRAYAEPKFSQNEPFAVLAHAYVVAFREDLKAAAEVLKGAKKRFPNDERIAVMSAQIAYVLNRREEMREAIARAKAIDPDDPEVIAADSNIRGDIDGEVNAAVEALRRAAAIAPGNSNVWNSLGLFESDRDRPLAAEEALRRAIEADPGSPVSYANLAILLLDQSRVDEAGALIDKALSLDPAFSVGYIARGRYLLQKGESAKGLEAILAGSAANPGLSQGLLMAAIAYYQDGDEELADQALDNADRLDPNDPVVASVRTAIAIDQYQADQAVIAAREAVRRYRQRGGDFAGLAINKEGGSYPAQAYRFLNLNEWSRFYGDRVFDPFSASTYFDLAAVERPALITGRPDISNIESGVGVDLTALNLTVQGLFFDPLAVSGPHRPHRPAAPPLPRRGSRRVPAASQRPQRLGRGCECPGLLERAASHLLQPHGKPREGQRARYHRPGWRGQRLRVRRRGSLGSRPLPRLRRGSEPGPGARTDRDGNQSLRRAAEFPVAARRSRLEPQLQRQERPDGSRLRPERPRPALHEYGQCRDPARHHHRRPRLDPQQDRRRLGRPVAYDRDRRPDPSLRP